MKKILLIAICIYFCNQLMAAPGDTTRVNVYNKFSMNRYGNFDKWVVLPSAAKKYQRVWLKYTVGCESSGQCEWDYTNKILYRQHTGIIDSSLQQAPSFTVNGQVKDSINYATDTTWVTSYNATTKKTDSTRSTPITIIRFLNFSQPTQPTDTLKVWPVQYYKYYYDTTGKKRDSVFVPVGATMKLTRTPYYKKFERVNDFELARMITPYAKFFPKTFQYDYLFDVTDYISLLKDSSEIRLTYEGYTFGFTANIDFIYIEGTPAREAYKVQTLWQGYFPYGNTNDPIENYLVPKTFNTDATASSYKLKIMVTGHGGESNEGCSEFCAKNYYLRMNNNLMDSRLIWKDNCGSNAIINQGGTWIYNRANWCPGELVKHFEYELTPVSGSNTLDIDMDAFTANGSAGYGYDVQLIYYKNGAFARDVSVEQIQSPTKDFWYNRVNPICDNAKIEVKNFGNQAVTSVEFSYQLGNSPAQIYTWNGNLPSQQSAVITLPNLNWDGFAGPNNFTVTVNKVNGQTDDNSLNNTRISQFDLPQVLPATFVIETRVNNVPVDNSYTLKDAKGTVIRSRNFSSFAANTFIRDTFNLSYGCYSFDFKDDQGNGLSFWAAPNDGSGSVRFVKIPIAILKTFNSDFGSFLNYNFRVSSQVGIKEQDFLLRTNVYPNPANTVLHIETTSPLSSATLTTLEGRMVRLYSKSDLDNSELNLLELPVGVYLLKLASAHGETKVHKVVIAR